MKHIFILLLSYFTLTINVYGQKFNKTLNKDSLLQTVLEDLPEPKRSEIQKMYNEGNEQSKEFLLFMLSMAKSSKKELIANIDSNYDRISFLKASYLRLVPKGYIVSLEFNPADRIFSTKESIDLRIEDLNNKQSDSKQDWNLEYNSKKLTQLLKPLGWTIETVATVKKMLADAKCISIDNGIITTVGFARSGMGKYSFKVFENDLTSEQIKQYNDGCTHIFYKKNLVLEYMGGAVGSQCFPD